MNRKKLVLAIFIMGFLVSSIIASDLSKAIVASDILELEKGDKVEGKLLYTNGTVTDKLVSYPTIAVEDVYTLTDIGMDVAQIKYALDIPVGSEDPLGMGDISDFEMTHIVLMDNRTTLLPAARLYFGNTTITFEANNVGPTTVDELFNFNKTILTLNNGTTYSYTWKEVQDDHPDDLNFLILMLVYLLLNAGYSEDWKYTLLGISPTANTNDNINYIEWQGGLLNLGLVIDKPAVTTSDGDSYDTIHVSYEYTSLFGFWEAPEVHAYYEASSGLLIRMIEKDGTEQYEFVPGTVTLGGIGFTPYSTIGIIVSLVSVGILVLYKRKRK
jgi:hypothetical protein